ncbi:hypothetical protein HNR42_001604 [Deinobacterium chartae]|uniref:Uncharacterized protein n=1 Tax=Deinobacterium chartae TaxID=521158 RepID=A0A841I1A0_9DEIO|nr:penicillin-binding protein [Deinobacterium chartae]MBB6098179.1 hypothetical protein [Deinobacterium chartae]
MRRLGSLVLTAALLGLPAAQARPALGSEVPPAPWSERAPRSYLIALYSFECGDLTEAWNTLRRLNLPLYAVNAERRPSPAPAALEVWRGSEATAFSRALKVRVYPTVLLVRDGRLLNLWEGEAAVRSLKGTDVL